MDITNSVYAGATNNEFENVHEINLASVSNIQKVLGDCELSQGATLKLAVDTAYPLASWLSNTQLAATLGKTIKPGTTQCFIDENNKWRIRIPASVYTTPVEDATTGCCFKSPDIAACGGSFPLNFLCLQDTETYMNSIMANNVSIDVRVQNLVDKGYSIQQAKDIINALQFAMYKAYCAVQGTDAGTPRTKPYHGLLKILQDPKVFKISAETGILAAFEVIGYRLQALSYNPSEYVFWCSMPVLMAIKSALTKDIFGNYPTNWEVNGESVSFMGIPFRTDKSCMTDYAEGKGTVMLLHSPSVCYIALNPLQYTLPEYTVRTRTENENAADGCATVTTKYNDVSTVACNDYNRIMLVNNVPLASAAVQAYADLGAIMDPYTIAPKIES